MDRGNCESGDYYHTYNQPSISGTSPSLPSPPTDRSASRSFRTALQGTQGSLPSRVTHLTLLGYVLVMDEWFQLMQLLPALQHLDIHISSISFADNTASPPGNTTPLHHEQIPSLQYQAMHEMEEMAIGISHITTNRSVSAESRSPTGQSDVGENGIGCHGDILVDTSNASRDHSCDTFIPGNVTSTLDQRRCRHSRDRNREQDHVALDEGESDRGKRCHDVAMEVDENMKCDNLSQLQREVHIQFTSVRSLVFRGEIVSAEMLAYLPRLENLSFAPVAVIFETSPPSCFSPSSQSGSGPVEVADTLMNKCPQVTHLALTEPSIISSRTESGWARHLPLLMYSMPELEHFMTSTQIMATHGNEIVPALLEHHSQRLKSFRVIASPASYGNHRHHQQRIGLKRQLSDTSFESTSEEDDTNHPLSMISKGSTTCPTKQHCLRVLESCPKLETFESRVDLSMQDVIASVSRWLCHDSIKVLALEVQELFNDCGSEEVAIMDMFIKTLLHGSRQSSPTAEIKGNQPSISECYHLPSLSTASSIPSTSSMDTFMSKSSAPSPGLSIPSASSSLSASKQHTHSILQQSEPIVANTFTTSPPSETLPSSTYFPSHRHAEASPTACDENMETGVDKGEAPKAYVLGKYDPPPILTTPSECCRAKYPVQAVGRLVALQYLVERQLTKLASLDQFSLGQTMYQMPKG